MPENIPRPSICTVVLKWVSSVLFGLVLLVCVIESKLCILAISNKMRNTSEMRYVRFVMLFLVVLVPSVLNLIRGFWRGAFRKDKPWPRKPVLLVGFLVSILEALGLCLFVFHIPGIKGMDQPCMVILVMNAVHLCPALYKMWQARKGRLRNTFAIIALLDFVGITIWLLLENIKVTDGWWLLVAVVVLSIAWTSYVQEQLVEPPRCTQTHNSFFLCDYLQDGQKGRKL
ncbi:uncharacterized protein LOC127841188 [Dreissena polymorpha]|uniref:uncharacterized protein LOC127841188 n=1 Tax=Dreissena polymorpha TaxID=45954 RepID=UPI002264DCBF|nr:uncharacterized protein LOC127841188 [Dreissena polymorpha]